MSSESDVRELAGRLRTAARLTVLTGAGVSAASGIPTFRGPDGLWRAFRAEELATPEAFARDPRLVWEWYDWRRQQIARAAPNQAHRVLAAWSRRFPAFTLVTQNVDGLHERAGTDGVVAYHGSIWVLSCWEECGEEAWRDERAALPELPPRCARCGGLARPGVVWFGEPIPSASVGQAAAALNCDVCLVVGTSSLVYPAAGLAAEAARRGAFTAEINPEPGAGVDLAIAGRAEEVLPRIDRMI
jgi:NAD-dependent protein deacetylase/lipoamidase